MVLSSFSIVFSFLVHLSIKFYFKMQEKTQVCSQYNLRGFVVIPTRYADAKRGQATALLEVNKVEVEKPDDDIRVREMMDIEMDTDKQTETEPAPAQQTINENKCRALVPYIPLTTVKQSLLGKFNEEFVVALRKGQKNNETGVINKKKRRSHHKRKSKNGHSELDLDLWELNINEMDRFAKLTRTLKVIKHVGRIVGQRCVVDRWRQEKCFQCLRYISRCFKKETRSATIAAGESVPSKTPKSIKMPCISV